MPNPHPKVHVEDRPGRGLCGYEITEFLSDSTIRFVGEVESFDEVTCSKCVDALARQQDDRKQRIQRARVRAYHRALRRLRVEHPDEFDMWHEQEYAYACVEEGLTREVARDRAQT